jgi:hypothetical protein
MVAIMSILVIDYGSPRNLKKQAPNSGKDMEKLLIF